MKLAAAKGIAEVVSDDDLSEDYVIPSVFNRDVAPAVAAAVVEEAKSEGLARVSEETGTFETVAPPRDVTVAGPQASVAGAAVESRPRRIDVAAAARASALGRQRRRREPLCALR